MLYRIQIPAIIMFNIKADSPEAAVKLAEQVRNENNDEGWDIDLYLDGEEMVDTNGRAYTDEDAIGATPLTVDCIVTEEIEEPSPPEQCSECGSSGKFNLLGVDVGGADRQAFVCDNCGHAHILS